MNWLLFTGLQNAVIAFVLAAFVYGVTKIWKNPPFAHLLWVLVLVKLITPPIAKLDIANWMLQPPREPSMEAVEQSPREEMSRQGITANVDVVSLPNSKSEAIDVPRPQTVNSHIGLMIDEHWGTIRITLTVIWIAGSSYLLLRTTVWTVQFSRFLRGTLPASRQVQQVADLLAQRFGLKCGPDVRVAECAATPFVWQVGGRATIVLPMRLVKVFEESQITLVLAHELAHLRRGDHWVRLLETAVSIVCWWNPLVWQVRRWLHAAEEQCCDAWVSWAFPEHVREYAQSLLEVAEMLPGTERAPILASPFLNRHTLQERIETILHYRSPRETSRFLTVVIAILALVVIPMGVNGGDDEKVKPTVVETPKPQKDKPNKDSQKVADDTQALQGGWKFDLYYSDWWPGQLRNPPVGWAKWNWIVKGNEIEWTGLKDGKVKLSFVIDPSKSPAQIDLTFLDGPHKGTKLLGIYEFSANGGCQIAFADPKAKSDRPTEIGYATDAGRTMALIERTADDGRESGDAPATDDRGAEIDAAIERLKSQGAKVREFHSRGDSRYWVQIVTNEFDDTKMLDVEIVSRGVPLDLHLNRTIVTPAGLERLASASRIDQLELSGPSVDDELLRALPKLQLRGQLGLDSDRLTNAGIQPLSKCRGLTAVTLGGSLSDKCLEHLLGLPNLQRVVLGKNFTRAAFDTLRHFGELTNVDLSAMRPNLEDLAKLPKLKVVTLAGQNCDDEAARVIAATFKSLESLSLRNTSITNVGVEHISRIESLTTLTLDGAPIDDGIAPSIRKMKRLTWLSLANSRVGDDTAAAISECPDMWYVFLVNTKVTDAGVAHLPKLKKPLSLYLANCSGVTDESVKSFSKMADSTSFNLNLELTGVTQQGVKELKAALPNSQIRWQAAIPSLPQ